jgi:hypothetical protein
MPWQQDVSVLDRAVDRSDHVATERPVADQPSKKVGEVVVPLLGRPIGAAWSPLLV